MPLSRLPAVLVAGLLLTGAVSCAQTVEGSGTLAADVATGEPQPSGGSSGEPSGQAKPSPSPTTDPVVVKQRLLCVLERAAISSINSQFNKSKERDGQIRILRAGATTIRGHIRRSGLPGSDRIRRAAQGVLDELDQLVADATAGKSPSTRPYNLTTETFQKACNAIS